MSYITHEPIFNLKNHLEAFAQEICPLTQEPCFLTGMLETHQLPSQVNIRKDKAAHFPRDTPVLINDQDTLCTPRSN